MVNPSRTTDDTKTNRGSVVSSSGKGNKEELKSGGKFQIGYILELGVWQFSWNQRKNTL